MKNLIRYCAASALCILSFNKSIYAGMGEALLDLSQSPPKLQIIFTPKEGSNAQNGVRFETIILSQYYSKDSHTITLRIPSEMVTGKENLDHNTRIRIESKIQSSAKEAKNITGTFTDNSQKDLVLTNALGHNSNSYPNSLWMSNRATKESERIENSPGNSAPQISTHHDSEAYASRLYLSYRGPRGANIWE